MASRYAGERVRRSVAIFCCTVEIARHPRSYDRGEFRFRTQTLPGTARTKARRARPGSALIYKVLYQPPQILTCAQSLVAIEAMTSDLAMRAFQASQQASRIAS